MSRDPALGGLDSPTSRPSDPSWLQVEAAFDAILDAPESAEELLAGLDPAVRGEVRSLLEHARAEGDALTEGLDRFAPSILEQVGEHLDEQEQRRLPVGVGDQLGSYRLLEPLGRGGMGVVFLAERADRQFEKRVAIKLVATLGHGRDARRRFLNERQLLADLEHPAIARLLDGGVAEGGAPYLVMEYVDGLPIDRYCEEHDLGLEARLELFVEICSAVGYAHRQLVVHRDLKPANILVDTQGRVKLLDFGIASLLEDAEGPSEQTVLHAFTPESAAPEQIRGRRAGTPTDVYALGVLLYRLLTLKLPYRVEGLSPIELEKVVCDQDPPKPSVAARTPGDHPREVPWARQLAGDLDNIVHKAMATESERRYSTAGELGRDIRRHLDHLPVEAAPVGRGYRIRKFARRHRLAVASAAAIVLALLLGLGLALWQANRAARERDLARREAVKSETVAQLLIDLFENADPYEANRSEPTVRELLARGESKIRDRLREQPAARTDVLAAIARAHKGIGSLERALVIAREVLEERRALGTADPEGLVESLIDVGSLESRLGNGEAALAAYEEALELQRVGARLDEPQSAIILSALGMSSYRSDPEASEAQLRRAVDIERRSSPEGSLQLARYLGNLAVTVDAQGRRDEGLALKNESLRMLEREVGPDHPDVATLRHNIAITLHGRGRLTEAESLYRGALKTREERLGADHPDLLASYASLGRLLLDRLDVEEAAIHLERAAELAERRPESFDAIAARINLGSLRREQGRLLEAEQLHSQALDVLEKQLGAATAPVARLESLLAETLHRRGLVDEAERLYRKALEIQSGSEVSMSVAETRLGLGALLCEGSAIDEGAGLVEAAQSNFEDLGSWASLRRSMVSVTLGLCRVAQGRDDEARRLLEDAFGALSGLPPESYWRGRAAQLRERLAS